MLLCFNHLSPIHYYPFAIHGKFSTHLLPTSSHPFAIHGKLSTHLLPNVSSVNSPTNISNFQKFTPTTLFLPSLPVFFLTLQESQPLNTRTRKLSFNYNSLFSPYLNYCYQAETTPK
ncbi:hypothetical protein OTU49_014738 [Cherax quadricarinatus]|uniref:Uncharacterized protein n=1 Tax=Cherax quadricarinatus TaxID=27406 RepID=A0AAW0YRU9_CHEQU